MSQHQRSQQVGGSIYPALRSTLEIYESVAFVFCFQCFFRRSASVTVHRWKLESSCKAYRSLFIIIMRDRSLCDEAVWVRSMTVGGRGGEVVSVFVSGTTRCLPFPRLHCGFFLHQDLRINIIGRLGLSPTVQYIWCRNHLRSACTYFTHLPFPISLFSEFEAKNMR